MIFKTSQQKDHLMKFKTLALTIALALSGLVSAGCSKDASSEDGCERDADCSAGQVCSASSSTCVTPTPGSNAMPGAGDMGGASDMPKTNPGGVCAPQETECGDRCCDKGFDCAQGACSCPAERFCQGACCESGQSCELGQCVDPCAGKRCGASLQLCCEGSSVCINGGCQEPGNTCEFNEQCEAGEVCEPILGACVEKPAERCEYRPPVGQFTPVIGCEWRPEGQPFDMRGDVVAAPIVMDVADEGEEQGFEIPEIIFPSFDRRGDGCCNASATIRVISGKCEGEDMRTIASISVDGQDLAGDGIPRWLLNDVAIAAGDLDGDGDPEIVAMTRSEGVRNDGTTYGVPGGLIAFTRSKADGSEWEVFWFNKDYPERLTHVNGGATISLADLEGDGSAEVVVGSLVFDGKSGDLKWDGTAYLADGTRTGQGHNVFGPVSSVVDVDGDGTSEVFAGNTLYNSDGSVKWAFEYDTSASRCIYKEGSAWEITCDGYNGVVDFDGDRKPEVISVRLGEIWVFDGITGEQEWKVEVPWEDCIHSSDMLKQNESGPPTVADFDGDGRPEIGTAGADFYAVADLDCDVDDWESKGCYSRGILWATPNQDCSSRSTASSVFDFEGDGAAEVVYVDEVKFYIMSGQTGEVLFESDDHQSNTRIELPVVADVDNDNNAEVIVASAWNNRMAQEHGPRGKSGLRVWQDASDNWVRTRRVWNQHSYHVTNISEDGTIPASEPPNWAIEGLNNYRQNVQPSGLFDAPDLVVRELRYSDALCGALGQLDVYLLLGNDGAQGVEAGVSYEVFAAAGEARELVASGTTTERLLPGQTVSLTFDWSVPAGMQASGFTLEATIDADMQHNECKEDNNTRKLPELFCAQQG